MTMGLGIQGAALSTSCTNAMIYVSNEMYVHSYHKIHTNNRMFSMFKKPFVLLKMNAYLDCAVPTAIQSFVAHASFLFISVYMGQMAHKSDMTSINIFHFF